MATYTNQKSPPETNDQLKPESANTALSTGRYTGERLLRDRPEIYEAITKSSLKKLCRCRK